MEVTEFAMAEIAQISLPLDLIKVQVKYSA